MQVDRVVEYITLREGIRKKKTRKEGRREGRKERWEDGKMGGGRAKSREAEGRYLAMFPTSYFKK